MERELPHDTEMEKFVLSAMLIQNGEIVPLVSSILEADDFYRPGHRVVYRALLDIYDAEGGTMDILALINELRRSGKLEAVGIEFTYSLAEYAHTTAYVEAYAREIKNKSLLRKAIAASDEIRQAAYRDDKPASEIIADAEAKLFSLYQGDSRSEFEHIDPIAKRVFEEIYKLVDNHTRISGVASGFADLDGVTSGFQKSDLILLAARPSMGKTALALNMAMNAADKGSNVAIFSLEMSKRQLGRRIISAVSEIDSGKLQNGSLTARDFAEIINSLEKVAKLPIYIDDTSGLTVSELRQKTRRLKLEQGVDMIIIDYLQLMQGKSKAENRQQEMSEISRGLKALARELDIPIIALSQLSRAVELRADKRPLLSDLRESGALEQDADLVMFLYREEYYDKETENANTAELIIAKNRNGATKTIALYFQREVMKFESVTSEEE